MKPITLTLISTAVSVAGCLWLMRPPHALSPATESVATASSPSNTGNVAAPSATLARVLPQRSGFRHWSELESADYRSYIANLRSIGCPELTVADIVRADVHALFAARRAELAGNKDGVGYWMRSLPDLAWKSTPLLTELEHEEAELLKVLLGQPTKPLGSNILQSIGSAGHSGLPALPAEKRERVRALETERDLRLTSVASSGAVDLLRAFAVAEAEIRQKLAAVLTADELLAYDLSTSPVAQELRDRQIGFELSESEYRELFAIRREADERTLELEASGDRTGGNGAQADAHERIKDLLGPERGAMYERAGDPDFQSFYRLHEEHGVPLASVEQAFSQTSAARRLAEGLLGSGDADRRQRLGAIAELEAALNDQLRTALGDEAWTRFRDAGSDPLGTYREQAADGRVGGAESEKGDGVPSPDTIGEGQPASAPAAYAVSAPGLTAGTDPSPTTATAR